MGAIEDGRFDGGFGGDILEPKLLSDSILKILMIEERIEEKLDAVLRKRSPTPRATTSAMQPLATYTTTPKILRSHSDEGSGIGSQELSGSRVLMMMNVRSDGNSPQAATPNLPGVRMRSTFQDWLDEEDQEHVEEGGDEIGHVCTFAIANNQSMRSEHSVSEENRFSKYIPIDPNSRFSLGWSFLTILVLLAELTYVPFVLAWDIDFGLQPISSVLFWGLDAAISFISGSYNAEGEINPLRVSARAYALSWFPLDISIVFMDVVSVLELGGGSSGVKLLRFSKLVRLWRIVSILRVSKLSRNFNRLLDAAPFGSGLRMVFRVCYLCVCILWSLHFIACFWFLIGKIGPTDTGERWLDMPLEQSDGTPVIINDMDRSFQYMICFHWSVATFTLGNMEVGYASSFERALGVTFIVLSFLFGSVLISLLSAIFVDHQNACMETTVKLRAVDRFLGENDVSNTLALRIQKVLLDRVKMKEKLAFHDAAALEYLPSSLHTDLRYEILGRFLRKHDLFNCWSTVSLHVTRDFSADGVAMIFLKPGDELFKSNTESEDSYFFSTGALTYTKGDGVKRANVVSVPEQTWLSEAALWSQWRHVGSCVADSRCKVAVTNHAKLTNHVKGHALIRAITLSYCQFFCHGIALAKPPTSKLPDDVCVPLTKFAEMLMHFRNDLRIIIGTQAIKVSKLGKKSAAKLEEEVTGGLSVVYINIWEELERTVLVTVMMLQDDDGQVLYQVGKVVRSMSANEDGHEERRYEAEPELKLPGLKQDRGEFLEDTFRRLVNKKLNILKDKLEHNNTLLEEEVAYSKDFGVKTRYLRTKLMCSMRTAFPAKLVSHDFGSGVERTPTSSSNPVVYLANNKAKGVGMNFLEAVTCAPISLYVIFEGGKPFIYAWLSQELAEALKQSTQHRRDEVLHRMLSHVNFAIIEEGPYDVEEPTRQKCERTTSLSRMFM